MAAAGLDVVVRPGLPDFRRQETWRRRRPLSQRRSRYADPLVDASIAAGAATGHDLSEDYRRPVFALAYARRPRTLGG
jgi:hypothetical protein